ncbi:MAG: SDR family oxidoreductase [Nocardiopsaceae bacterium]|jgi:NAD(P)-dependent dehydrogenase (short-subunit alcohol dehydrogenase family)|nr:SDR family oxidoreductase [Nocardiopsaceae bacterium]
MEVKDRVAVVTGGASGIGRALCLALADHGAAAVVVSDTDGPGAASVAAEITGRGRAALAVTADVSNEADVQALSARAEREFGRIDLFFSNAGIIVAGGIEVPDDAWAKMWAVNVQSHIYVARSVLPGMLARGGGYLVITASAAGLLTQLGSAPYAVTKHAAVAFAEWLSITYGDQGIGVSCLCPQAVTTNLGATSMREVGQLAPPPPETGAVPSAAGAGSVSRQASVDGVLSPEEVAANVLATIADARFLILPHPEVATYERRRAEDRDRWLSGMRRLHGRLVGRG